MRYIIGVDGGGTKTEIVVCSPNGNLIKREIGGSSNPIDIGNERMAEVICALIEKVLPQDCDSAEIGLGISGIFTAGSESYLCEKIKEAFPIFQRIAVYSDKDSSLNCAYDKDGCIVILGTGCVGAVKKKGNVKDVGGGGYLVDCGISGFDLGREVLNVALSVEDGRIEKSIIADLFYERTKESVRTHLKKVYAKGKAYIASFAPMAFFALEQGDLAAKSVFKKCVFEFEKLLWAMYKEWGKEICEITLFGGLTQRFCMIEQFLSEELKGKFVFKTPKYPIIYGLMKDFAKDKDFAETFYQQYAEIKGK